MNKSMKAPDRIANSDSQSPVRVPAPDNGTEAGFSVLEAIVSVAILGIALIPLLSLQSNNARNALALERANQRAIVQRVAASYLNTIDPVENPSGEMSLGGGWSMTWESHASGEPKPALYSIGLFGRYEVALYEIVADISGENGESFAISAQQIGAIELVSAAPQL